MKCWYTNAEATSVVSGRQHKRSVYMTKKKLSKEELKQKQKAGRKLDANIRKYLKETSKRP